MAFITVLLVPGSIRCPNVLLLDISSSINVPYYHGLITAPKQNETYKRGLGPQHCSTRSFIYFVSPPVKSRWKPRYPPTHHSLFPLHFVPHALLSKPGEVSEISIEIHVTFMRRFSWMGCQAT